MRKKCINQSINRIAFDRYALTCDTFYVESLMKKQFSGDIMFRTTIPNAYLRRVARLTRKLIQGINGTMTYVDLIRDLAGKFGRIREYMHEDAVIFTRNMNDLTVQHTANT